MSGMKISDLLSEQHTACYDQDVWFVSLRSAVAGVTAEQADCRHDGLDHSIRETVEHIIFWNERWLQRYRGELNVPQDVENTGTFNASGRDWQQTLEKLDAVMLEWRQILADITAEKLISAVNPQDNSPWWSPLAQQNIHNAYHVGQIILLRKLQGSWDPTKGVS